MIETGDGGDSQAEHEGRLRGKKECGKRVELKYHV